MDKNMKAHEQTANETHLLALSMALRGKAQKLPKTVSKLSFHTWRLLQGARHV